MNISSTRLFQFALVVLFLFAPSLVRAQAPVSNDSWAQAGSNKNNGADQGLNVSSGSSGQNAYIKFDLNVFPSGLTGSDVQRATLKLFVDHIGQPGTFYVCRLYLSPSWTESTLTGQNAPFCDTSTAPVPVSVSASQNYDYLVIDITAIVQYWFANPGTNNGVGL